MVCRTPSDDVAKGIQAAAITPALLFTFVFNSLLIAARRSVYKAFLAAEGQKPTIPIAKDPRSMSKSAPVRHWLIESTKRALHDEIHIMPRFARSSLALSLWSSAAAASLQRECPGRTASDRTRYAAAALRRGARDSRLSRIRRARAPGLRHRQRPPLRQADRDRRPRCQGQAAQRQGDLRQRRDQEALYQHDQAVDVSSTW